MYCTFCGKQIADDAAFCQYCGKPAARDDTLADLVAAARTGSQDAVSALYEKTYSKVYYTVKSMVKDEDAVFDIVQDTYIKAFTHLEGFQGDTRFLPWVRQIAANTARDWLKKKRPMLFTEMNSGEGEDIPVEELLQDERGENLPDQVMDEKETRRLIREIIEELPEDQRAAIGMFYYEEMSVKEIAAAMDVSESAIKSRLMYGRGKIEKKVRELEKRGTKLYGLSPLPFLLFLFRSQKMYGVKTPDGRILQTILALQPTGAGTVGVSAGMGTVGASAGAGTAAGGLGALKLGLVVLAVMGAVGLGIFGAVRPDSGSADPQEPSAMEDGAGRGETEAPKEAETTEEASPVDEALEQYRIIIGQADSYTYYEGEMDQWCELAGYRYALVQMQPDDTIPTLLLKREEMDTETSVSRGYVRVFQYAPDTKMVHQPIEAIPDGGIRGGLAMAGDGYGIFDTQWSGGTGKGSVSRITLEGDFLNRDICWSGQIFEMPDSITSVEIEWHEAADLSALDRFEMPVPEAPSGQGSGGALPTDEDRIVLTGMAGTYDYDEIVALQGQPDPDAAYRYEGQPIIRDIHVLE